MEIKEIINTLKQHFKETYIQVQEHKKISQYNHKFFVQAEKDAWKEIKEKYPNKHEWEQYYYFSSLRERKILDLRPQMKTYPIFVFDNNIILTLKHIIYNRLRNKKRGHTHDDQKFIETHIGTAKLICERMGLQQNILEKSYVNT